MPSLTASVPGRLPRLARAPSASSSAALVTVTTASTSVLETVGGETEPTSSSTASASSTATSMEGSARASAAGASGSMPRVTAKFAAEDSRRPGGWVGLNSSVAALVIATEQEGSFWHSTWARASRISSAVLPGGRVAVRMALLLSTTATSSAATSSEAHPPDDPKTWHA